MKALLSFFVFFFSPPHFCLFASRNIKSGTLLTRVMRTVALHTSAVQLPTVLMHEEFYLLFFLAGRTKSSATDGPVAPLCLDSRKSVWDYRKSGVDVVARKRSKICN